MEGHMRRVCRLAVTAAMIGVLASCGSTDNGPTGSDALVLQVLGFNDMNITQCDQVNADGAEIDLIRDECTMGGQTTPEPFTQTSANASLQNNQKLDITLNSYSVNYVGTGAPEMTFSAGQTVTGKRCNNDTTRSCAVDSDCIILGGGVGLCQPSITTIEVLLASFTTKDFLLPDVFTTVPSVVVTFFGTDVTGATWVAQSSIEATLWDFDNCACTLTQ